MLQCVHEKFTMGHFTVLISVSDKVRSLESHSWMITYVPMNRFVNLEEYTRFFIAVQLVNLSEITLLRFQNVCL